MSEEIRKILERSKITSLVTDEELDNVIKDIKCPECENATEIRLQILDKETIFISCMKCRITFKAFKMCKETIQR